MTAPGLRLHDVFISHAREDKARFVDALDVALRERDVKCWYDSREIRLGDDFVRKMDDGLAHARYAVVILSPNFFKYWPLAELSALFNQEATFEQSRILPVRLDVDRATVTARLPLLAARADTSWEHGVEAVADRIRDVVRGERATTTATASGVLSRPYNLPARRVQTLFGRDADIDHVLDLLRPGKSVRVAASVEGLAGVGKTELALHLVDRLSQTDRFPGGIFWFDAENPNLAPAWGGVIADALAVGPGTLEERAAGAVRLASNGPPVLVVLDNVESWTKDTEPRPLPSGPQVSFLVTTRQRWLSGPSFQHHTLEVLGVDAARELLRAVSGRALGRADGTEELLNHLDGHALALELAGAYLREFSSVSPRRYLDDLVSGGQGEDRVKDHVRYERSVQQALDVHIRHLDRNARRALRIAACFAPEDASNTLLELCGVGPDAQQPLRRFHLISGGGDRWRMHRLVRSWAHSKATRKERRSARQAFVDGCVALATTIELSDGFRVYRADGPHLEQAITDIAQVFGESDVRLAKLLDRLGTALQSTGDLARARAMMERAVALDESHREADDSSVMRRSNLALVLRDLGDFSRARELMEQVLASELKRFGADHPRLAISRSNLGAVLYQLDDLSLAKELLEAALASDLENFGDDYLRVSVHRTNLALVSKRLGDLTRAKNLQEQVLASRLKTLGADHPMVAIARFNLARTHEAQNDFPGARALLAEGLRILDHALGPDHPHTANTRAALAGVLLILGETEAAHREITRAVEAVATQPPGSSFRRNVEFVAAKIREGIA